MRLALITIACLAASVSAARPLSPFGVPRGGSAVSDYAGLCETVKGSIVEKAGQSVSGLSFIACANVLVDRILVLLNYGISSHLLLLCPP